jgi:tRNA C32,U32 (ribose-2'-O)-methylase TrmJ
MIATLETLESRTLMSVVPVISAAQKQNLTKLATDLKTIAGNSNVTKTEVSSLVSAIQAVDEVATKPNPSLVTKLATDLKTDLKAGPLTAKEKVQLYTDFSNILVSANVPASLAQVVAADAKAILISSNITNADVKLIAGDLTAISKTFKANH